MAVQATTRNSFALTAGKGCTPQPLNILGTEVLVKLANADSDGAAAIFSHAVAPMSGPPLHRHSREDEWFYVLDGEITLEIEGQRIALRRGGSAFAARGSAHTFQNFSDAPAEILVVVTPGGFNEFFEELSLFSQQASVSDKAGIEPIARKFGIEILGPPLA
jgi:quercetin dioxygenase-like cupin family protein